MVLLGFVGLTMTYALNLRGCQGFLTRWYSSLDNYIISVERIKQFTQILSESPATIEALRPPPQWPKEGRIDLLDLRVYKIKNKSCIQHISQIFTPAVVIFCGLYRSSTAPTRLWSSRG